MMSQVKIADFSIGKECSPFIIAEAGINHNGDCERALRMVDLAKEVGADCIKFQTFHAPDFIADPQLTYSYYSQGKAITESMMAMFERCEFSKDDWKRIVAYCREKNIIFLSTPQNYSDLSLLLQLGISAIKVGSDDFVNLPLLKEYAETGLPLILSCGMATIADVHAALETVRWYDGYPVILLLCTSEYPTPPEDVHLSRLKTLQDAFPQLLVGFSDHTCGEIASVMACGLGACVFEKHFTLDHNLPGPDHWFSADPGELKKWVSAIRNSFLMRGKPYMIPTETEKRSRNVSQRVLVAAREIRCGEILNHDCLALKRVQNGGISSEFLSIFLGKKARRNYQKNEPLSWE